MKYFLDSISMKKAILFVLLLWSMQFIVAQNIKGTVVNEENKTLPYVTVRLLKPDSTFVQATCTDSLGVYSIDFKQKGNFLVSLSSIGYQTKIFPVELQSNKQLPVIMLKTDNVVLNEITIKGTSFIRQEDRISIYPDNKQIKHSATGYDLLYRLMIPEIDVDRLKGKVSTLGGEATLYIDGRKVDSREIQNLHPKEIEKVEYFDVPVGKYMNDVVAINFITKKYKTGGYVSLNAEQRIGYLSGNYNAVAKLAHNSTRYTFFIGHSMSSYNGTMNNTQEHFVFSDHETSRYSGMLENKMKNNNQYAQLNLANQNDKHSITGKLFFVRNDIPNNYSRSMVKYGNSDKRQESLKNTDQSGWKSGMELYGYFQLTNKQFFEATLQGSYANNLYAYAYRENTYSTLTNSKEDLFDFSIIINYGIQLERQNSLTIQAYHLHTISTVDYKGNTSSWQHFWDGESLLFLEYNQKMGKKLSFRFAPGLSYMQYRLHGDDRKDKFSARLHFNLIYRPSKNQQIRLGCPIGNGYLRIDQLNEVEQQIDSLQIRRGNPHQKIAFQTTPMITYSGQFGRVNIGGNLSYNIINNAAVECFYIENDKLIRSVQSEGKHRSFTSQLSAAWKVTDNLRIKLMGSWQYVKYKLTPEKLKYCFGSAQIDYYWNNFSCGGFIRSRTKWLNLNLMRGTDPIQYGGYVNWNHNNWHIEGGFRNLFIKHNKKESAMDRGVYDYKNVVISKLQQQNGYVKIAYTLDFGKKTSRDNTTIDKSINSTILKVN